MDGGQEAPFPQRKSSVPDLIGTGWQMDPSSPLVSAVRNLVRGRSALAACRSWQLLVCRCQCPCCGGHHPPAAQGTPTSPQRLGQTTAFCSAVVLPQAEISAR